MYLSKIVTQGVKYLTRNAAPIVKSAKPTLKSAASIIDDNVMQSNTTALSGIIQRIHDPSAISKTPLYKKSLKKILYNLEDSSLCKNFNILDNYMRKTKEYSVKNIYELLKMPKKQKGFIQYAYAKLVYDKTIQQVRTLQPDELIKLLKKHPEVDSDALSKMFSLFANFKKPSDNITLKELDNLLNNKKLIAELKETTDCTKNLAAPIENINIAKRRIPKYIYHLTNKESYEKMLASGEIKMSKDVNFNGVFAIELPNFFKRWCASDLGKSLIRQTSKYSDRLVLLKIPTEKLKYENLFMRSQDSYFAKQKNLTDIYREAKQNGKDINTMLRSWVDKYCGDDYARHIQGQTPASYAAKFKQNKEPIEYIYKDIIPMNNVEKIGEVSLKNFTHRDENGLFSYDVKNIFLELLKDTPEAKGAELLKRT